MPGRNLTADCLLTIDEVAEYLRVPVKTLYDWRHRGLGPTGLRVGRYVRYRRADVDAWLDRRAGTGKSAPADWADTAG